MKYEHITEGRFIERPNRFIAHVEINGQVETVHVKNTGRCRELLVPGTQVFLEKSSNPARKTAYDLIWNFHRSSPALPELFPEKDVLPLPTPVLLYWESENPY